MPIEGAENAPAVVSSQREQPSTASRSQWPFLRGPNYDGHSDETGLVDSFPERGPPVRWTCTLGAGYSGFTASAGCVFTQYQTLRGQFIVCLDAETGETIWEYRYGWPYDPAGLYPGPRATPTLDNEHVYFSAPDGLVGCLRIDTGDLVWSLNVFSHFKVEPVEFGYSCSPVVVGGRLLVPVGKPAASLVALQAGTGQVLWQTGNDPISHVPALPIVFQGQQLVVGYLRNSLLLVDLESGAIVARRPLSHGYDEHAAWPIYREPWLWISAPFQAGSELLELRREPVAPQHATERDELAVEFHTVWKSRLMSNDVCSSILVGDELYGFDLRDVQSKAHRASRGQFRCLDFATGRELWNNGTGRTRKERSMKEASADNLTPTPVIGHASVRLADGKLVMLNDLGELILARANPQRYEELARVPVLGGEIVWTPPMLYRSCAFLRNASRAVCIDLRAEEPATGHSGRPVLRVADIPQSAYRDWTALLLPIEPEYAMDVPSIQQLLVWFWAAIGCGTVAVLIPSLALVTPWGSIPGLRRDAWLLAVVLAAAMPTILGHWLGEFYFTWPLGLYCFLLLVVIRADCGGGERQSAWRSRIPLFVFVAICFAYFRLCGRLSLATEWVFLMGFPAALPFLLWYRRSQSGIKSRLAAEAVAAVLGFAGYYWGSVAILFWKYSL